MEAAVGSITVCPLKRQLEDAKTWARAALKEVAAPNSHQVEAGVIVGPVGSAHHRSASDHDVLPLLVVAVMVRATMIVMRIETALRILATIPATHLVRPSHSCHEARRPRTTTGMSAIGDEPGGHVCLKAGPPPQQQPTNPPCPASAYMTSRFHIRLVDYTPSESRAGCASSHAAQAKARRDPAAGDAGASDARRPRRSCYLRHHGAAMQPKETWFGEPLPLRKLQARAYARRVPRARRLGGRPQPRHQAWFRRLW